MPRISNLPALTTPDNSDELAIVDTSASVTKKITRGDLLKAPLPTNSVTTAAITDGAVTAQKIDFATYPAPAVDANGWTVYEYPKWKVYRKRIVFSASSTTAADEDRQSWSVLPVGMSTLPPPSSLSVSNTTNSFGGKLGISVVAFNPGSENRVYVTWTNNSSTTRTFIDMSANVEIIA